MTNKNDDCYIIKQKDGILLKFYYDIQIGVCYQIFIKKCWSEKKVIYKECFEHFYILVNENGGIYVFCQDICGDLILCTLEEKEWKSKILLHMKHNVIMPIYIRGLFCRDDIHLFYNLVDRHTYSEVLVHQVAKNGTSWSVPQIIGEFNYCNIFPYHILKDCKSNLCLLNTTLSGEHQLTSRIFYEVEGSWGKEDIIYKSLSPYVDYTFCEDENILHFLFIVQEEQVNRVIYQYKDLEIQKNIILFQCERIDSCLLTVSNKILWALWICDNKLYGCFSTNCGQSFSSPKVYRHFDMGIPVKIFYQECLQQKQSNYTVHQIYVMYINGQEQFFLQELLEDSLAADMVEEISLKDILGTSASEKENLKDYSAKIYTKVEVLEREKGELQAKLKTAQEELIRLNETIHHEKDQISRLKYQLYTEKEKIKVYLNDNESLKEKNSYLKQKLLSKDKEKVFFDKKLAEKEKENKILKQQIKVIMDQNVPNQKTSLKKNFNDNSKPAKFSLIKWLFEE